MEGKDILKLVLIILILWQFIAFLIFMFGYFDILHNIEKEPMNPQNFLDFGNWIKDFILGEVFGLPLSVLITALGYLVKDRRRRSFDNF